MQSNPQFAIRTISAPSAAKFCSRIAEDADWRRVVQELGGPVSGWNASSGQSLTRRLLPPRTDPTVFTVRMWCKLWNAFVAAQNELLVIVEHEDMAAGLLPPMWGADGSSGTFSTTQTPVGNCITQTLHVWNI